MTDTDRQDGEFGLGCTQAGARGYDHSQSIKYLEDAENGDTSTANQAF